MSDCRLRIMIVEDEALLALVLEQDLVEAGYTTVGPFRDVTAARRAASDETFDMAILDINLNGERVYPVAEELAARGIPFCFLSGYGGESVSEQFREFPRLAKPYDLTQLLRTLENVGANLAPAAGRGR